MQVPPSPDHSSDAARVSVVIPTHERPEMLRRAVQAVLMQEYSGHIECVVVFDKSTPTAIDVEVTDDRSLVLVENVRTPGLAGARNSGVLASTGDLVGFCDDDDEWLQGKLDPQVRLLRERPDVAVVATGILIRYRGKDIPRPAPSKATTFEQFLRDRTMEINPCTVLVRRSDLLGQIGLVDEEIPGAYGEDYEWLLRAARISPVVSVPDPLVRIHWHDSSFYAGRWRTMIAGLEYLLDRYPEFKTQPAGLGRIHGQLAFAHAALGERRTAVPMALRSLRHARGNRHAYAALAVSARAVSAERVLLLARSRGRGI